MSANSPASVIFFAANRARTPKSNLCADASVPARGSSAHAQSAALLLPLLGFCFSSLLKNSTVTPLRNFDGVCCETTTKIGAGGGVGGKDKAGA